MALAPIDHFDLHGCFDGFVVTYRGRVVETWPTLTGAARGLVLARRALAELDATLAKTEARS